MWIELPNPMPSPALTVVVGSAVDCQKISLSPPLLLCFFLSKKMKMNTFYNMVSTGGVGRSRFFFLPVYRFDKYLITIALAVTRKMEIMSRNRTAFFWEGGPLEIYCEAMETLNLKRACQMTSLNWKQFLSL